MSRSNNILLDFGRYIQKPVYTRASRPPTTTRGWLNVLLGLVFIDVVALFIDQPLRALGLRFVDYLTGFVPEYNGYSEGGWQNILVIVIYIPVIEELVFRLPLRSNYFSGFATVSVLAVFIFSMYRHWIEWCYIYQLGSVIFIGATVWGVVENKSIKELVSAWWARQFHWLFWINALGFGLLHITNFSNISGGYYWLTPLLTIHQLFLGLLFGWARMRYGIIISIVIHWLNNLLDVAFF